MYRTVYLFVEIRIISYEQKKNKQTKKKDKTKQDKLRIKTSVMTVR